MRILVHHRTEYRYTQPLTQSVQYLRLTPRSGTSQTVNRWKIACPGADLTEWVDHYGNVCHTLAIARPITSVLIEVLGDVRTIDTNGVIPSGTTTLPFEVFLRETAYTQPDRALAKFAQKFRPPVEKDPIAGLHQLMLGVQEAVAYEKNHTTVHTTAAETLAAGRGVCQDHAHVFIAACRQLGVPARYVSGYLGHGEGTQQTTASHAWAEALVPDLGSMILMDVEMPHKDGISAAKELADDPKTKNIPIIFTTNLRRELVESLASGASLPINTHNYFRKDDDYGRLMTEIRQAVAA